MWVLRVLLEVKCDDRWESAHTWVADGPDMRPARPLYETGPGGDPVALQGVFCPDRPLAPELAVLPTTPGLEGKGCDPESISYLTHSAGSCFAEKAQPSCAGTVDLQDVLRYAWHTPVRRYYKVSPVALSYWKDVGVVPTWAFDEEDTLRTEEIFETIKPSELWGDTWLYNTLPRLRAYSETSRLLFSLTKEY